MSFFDNGSGVEGGNGSKMGPDCPSFQVLNQVSAYWMALCEGGLPPLRSRIDPRGIEGALSYSFLLERIATGMARFRIAGMHLTDLMGMDVRGMPISACLDPSARPGFATDLEKVFEARSKLEMSLEAERGIGRPALEARLLVLPLRTDPGNPAIALGCLVTSGQIGRGPRRFFISKRAVTPELGNRGAAPFALTAISGFADAPASFAGRGTKARPSYLRLVETGD